MGFGTHVTPDPEFSSEYAIGNAARKGPSPNIMPLKVNLGNMLDANQIVKEGTEEFELAKKLAGKRLFTQNDENGVKSVFLQNAIDSTSPARAYNILRDAGYDSVKYKAKIKTPLVGNAYIPGREADAYTVLNPANIRSRFAQFDPAKQDSSDLLAGLAPGGLAMELLRQAAMADEPAPEGYAEGGKTRLSPGGDAANPKEGYTEDDYLYPRSSGRGGFTGDVTSAYNRAGRPDSPLSDAAHLAYEFVVPQTPQDLALMMAFGPGLGKAARVALAASGISAMPSDAQASGSSGLTKKAKALMAKFKVEKAEKAEPGYLKAMFPIAAASGAEAEGYADGGRAEGDGFTIVKDAGRYYAVPSSLVPGGSAMRYLQEVVE
jgi:hypothetical protein